MGSYMKAILNEEMMRNAPRAICEFFYELSNVMGVKLGVLYSDDFKNDRYVFVAEWDNNRPIRTDAKCPHCGAPIEKSVCAYCGRNVFEGE